MFSIGRDSVRTAKQPTEFDPNGANRARLFAECGEPLSLAVVSTIESLADDWRILQLRAPVSPYQTFDLAEAWLLHAAAAAGFEPCIGVLRNAAGKVVAILPFGLVHRLGTAVGVYLGGSHFNVNLPLVDPGLSLGPGSLARIFDAYCGITGADLLHLANQPVEWRAVQHPFLCLPHHEAPDDISLISIDGGDFPRFLATGISRKVRSELRRKAAKFAEAGARAVRADTPQAVEQFLDSFMAQKSQRLSSQGLDDPFAAPGISGFFRAAALHGLNGTEGVEFHALQTPDGRLLAVRAGARHQAQYALMVQSFDTDDPAAKYSPSEYLIAEVLADGCRRGFTEFDFGVGSSRSKQIWANGVAELFDVTYAVNAKGRLYAGLVQLAGAAARCIKRNPKLFAAVQDARALRVSAALANKQIWRHPLSLLSQTSLQARADTVWPDPIAQRRDALFRESAWQRCQRVALGTAWSLLPRRVGNLVPLARIWVSDLVSPTEGLPSADVPAVNGAFAGMAHDLSPATLVAAYQRGLFPKGHFGPLKWVSPRERCVLFFDQYHISRRIRSIMRQDKYTVSFDRDFEGYAALYDAGYVHSFEVWNKDGELVGGGYGVALGGIFVIESQFSHESNTSKIGFSVLNWHLAKWGFLMSDNKLPTPATLQMGFRVIPRGEYLRDLTPALALGRHGRPGRWEVEAGPKLVADWHPDKAASKPMP